MDLCNSNEIKTLLARHGFRFSKSMGQNFLIESWVPRDIAEASGASLQTGVLEIGPGIGPLTVQLAQRAGRVVCLELDEALLPILAETLSSYGNTEVLSGDILKADLAALVTEKLAGLTPIVCANLPYNITTPVLTALIESGLFASITVMIQREVARPLCRRTRHAGLWCVFCLLPVLHHAASALRRTAGLFSSRAQGHLFCDPLRTPPRACSRPSG